MDELHGKVAVVTGAAGGIGAALSRRLQREGCRLALVDLEEPRDLAGQNDSLHAIDVAEADAWNDLAPPR